MKRKHIIRELLLDKFFLPHAWYEKLTEHVEKTRTFQYAMTPDELKFAYRTYKPTSEEWSVEVELPNRRDNYEVLFNTSMIKPLDESYYFTATNKVSRHYDGTFPKRGGIINHLVIVQGRFAIDEDGRIISVNILHEEVDLFDVR